MTYSDAIASRMTQLVALAERFMTAKRDDRMAVDRCAIRRATRLIE